MSYRKSVAVGSKEKKGRQYVNFFLFKKNKRGEFQRRMLQVDVSNNLIRNIKNFREKERQRFKFADVKLALADDLNPLACTIEFNNKTPFELFLYSPSQRDDLVKLLNDIVKNTAAKKDTELNLSENLLKEGGADYKKKTIGWDRRYLYLYPLYLHCFSQDNADVSRHVINLFATPISKEGEKVISIHSTLQLYQFRFDTQEQRDEWFNWIIKASHNEGFEWNALSEDVDFKSDYANAKKEVESAAEQVRSTIVQNTQIAREKDILSRDLEAVKNSRKSSQLEITKIQEEKRQEDSRNGDLEKRLKEMREMAEKAKSTLDKSDDARRIAEDKYKAGHEIVLVIQANHNNVTGDLATIMQQLQEVESSARQLDSTIADMNKSPELIAAQISQIERDISLTQEKKKMEEGKVSVLSEGEQVFSEKLTSLEKRKEEALKMKQAALDMLQASKAEAESQQLATNLLRTELDLVVDKEKTARKEIQQTQELTSQVNAQTETLKRELASMA